MSEDPTDAPTDRRQRLVGAIVDARSAGGAVAFTATTPTGEVRVDYEDRTLRLELDAEARDRLEALLADYHVFKLEQPATRKAADGVVYLSAVTDPKHAADFLEALFREVYGAAEGYELQVA